MSNTTPSIIYIDQEQIRQKLAEAVPVIQERLAGNSYTPEQVQSALVFWLESSIETLADEVTYHCAEGPTSNRFNYRAFEESLKHLPIAS